jgi:NAD(P)-dependent dehydrogenase (short-subunit alcohol dehydrogenase family)
MELKNKVVLITGASSGIGKTTALRFAKEGAKVVITYHINKEGAEKTKQEIEKAGSICYCFKLDLADQNDINSLFEKINKDIGSLDILINNAGQPFELVPFLEASQQDILDLLNINVVGMMLCAKKAYEIMKKQGHGKILNTSSIKGWEHGGGSVAYAVSKAAVNSFTRTFAKQVAPDVQVNGVAPGYVKTRSYDELPEEKTNKWLDGTYLKRWITEDEIADAFIFLAKNDAITGQILYIDGGYTLK